MGLELTTPKIQPARHPLCSLSCRVHFVKSHHTQQL